MGREITHHTYIHKKTAAFCGCFTLERDILPQLAQWASPAGLGKLCCYMQTFHTSVSCSLGHENQTKKRQLVLSLCVTLWDAVGCSDTVWRSVAQWRSVTQCDTVKSHRQNRARILPESCRIWCSIAVSRPVWCVIFKNFAGHPPIPLFPGSIPAESRRHFGSICHTEKEQFPMQPVSICLISR